MLRAIKVSISPINIIILPTSPEMDPPKDENSNEKDSN